MLSIHVSANAGEPVPGRRICLSIWTPKEHKVSFTAYLTITEAQKLQSQLADSLNQAER